MQQYQVGKGLIISKDGNLYEYTDRAVGEFYFQALDTGKRIIIKEPDFWPGVEQGSIVVLHSIVSEKIVQTQSTKSYQSQFISELSHSHFADLKRKLDYIKGIVKEGVTRGNRNSLKRIILKIASDINDSDPPAVSTVQGWMLTYQTSSDPNAALVTGNAFRRRSSSFDNETEAFLHDQIQLQYANFNRPSVNTAYLGYEKELRKENARRRSNGDRELHKVAEKTFYNRIKQLPAKEILIARYGYEEARKQLNVSKGNLPADYPLDVVEIDHTLMNLYVVDDISFIPLGRPWITAIKDRHSHILLGFYISFHAGGLKNIFGAIKHSLCSHQKAYERWSDLENPWPAFGLGQIYCSDRGTDFLSQQYASAILDIGASYEYCQRRTPWLKGSIERFFNTLESTFFETMPGKTFNSLENRKDYNPSKESVIRFSTLVYLIHKWAADYHNIKPHSRKMASPLELWNEGIEIAPPRYPAFFDALDVIFGLRKTGTLQNEGIQFLGLHYASDELKGLVDDVGKKTKVEFVIPHENLGYLHLKDPRNNQYMKVNCTRPDYAKGLTMYQHEYLRHEAKLHSVSMRSIDSLLDFREDFTQKINEEIDEKDNYVKKQLVLAAGINSNAVLEGKSRSTTNVFGNLTEELLPVAIVPEPVNDIVMPFTSIAAYEWS